MTFGALKDIIAGLVLNGDESVWRDGMPTWQPVSAVPGLLPAPKAVDQAVVPLLNQRIALGLKKFVATLPSATVSASADSVSPASANAIETEPATNDAPTIMRKATVTLKKATLEPVAAVSGSSSPASSPTLDATSVAAVAATVVRLPGHATPDATAVTDITSTSTPTTTTRPAPPPPSNKDTRVGSVSKKPPAKPKTGSGEVSNPPASPAAAAAAAAAVITGDIELTSNPLFRGSDASSERAHATPVFASTTTSSQPVAENEV
jgi:hypothetical protein